MKLFLSFHISSIGWWYQLTLRSTLERYWPNIRYQYQYGCIPTYKVSLMWPCLNFWLLRSSCSLFLYFLFSNKKLNDKIQIRIHLLFMVHGSVIMLLTFWHETQTMPDNWTTSPRRCEVPAGCAQLEVATEFSVISTSHRVDSEKGWWLLHCEQNPVDDKCHSTPGTFEGGERYPRVISDHLNLYTSAWVPDHTTRHGRHRLEWSKEHLRWSANQWASVLLSDERWFPLSRNDVTKDLEISMHQLLSWCYSVGRCVQSMQICPTIVKGTVTTSYYHN